MTITVHAGPQAPPKTITVFTHQYPGQTAGAIRRLIELATARGVTVHLPHDEVEKHRLHERDGVVFGAGQEAPTDLAVVLGGDGTILQTLRLYAGRDVPVFTFNFGQIGFLATIDHDQLEDGIRRVLEGDFDVHDVPVLSIDLGDGERVAINDVSLHRRPDGRVAEMAYSVEGAPLGRVRCDGLVISTPVGSTGYNLANGGPVLAWGVEGYVVSFIAPHTLTARALVVATDAVLTVTNLSQRDSVDLTTDGRLAGTLGPGQDLPVTFVHGRVRVAMLPGTTFYNRFNARFGRLSR